MTVPCPNCGQLLRPDQAPGTCPACLVSLAVGMTADDPPGTEDVERLKTLGPYQLLRVLGEGGFGTVYAAVQAEPIRREVAVKVLKPGMDTAQVLARFRVEQQALAVLDHPNIAQVYDAGMTKAGRPYFVMELIEGIPLTEFCDSKKLTIRERLELFLPVCRAIAYAHQQGILHRDLKSSNILVTESQGKAVPKVIDFGIAKAMGEQAADVTILTRDQQFIGTPAAMSPEQAMGERSIDARADVYALGVLLYQLLTGQTPLDESATGESSHHELLLLIRENDASRPSVRVRRLSPERQSQAAAVRGERSDSLAKAIAGDLDWIVSKALFRDRELRYPTPIHFAEDLERHLEHRAIEARAPTFWYVVKNFARRHTAACLTSGVVLLGIVAAGIAILNSSARAQRQAERSEALADSLVDILFTKGASNGYESDYTVQALIIDSEDKIREHLAPFPDLEARALARLGEALLASGNLKRSLPVFRRACLLAEDRFGKESFEWLFPATLLASALERSEAFEEAVANGKEAYEVSTALNGPDHLETVQAMADYARYRLQYLKDEDVDELRECENHLREAATFFENSSEPDAKVRLVKIFYYLFWVAFEEGDYPLAENYARKRLEAVSKLENHETVDIELGRVLLAAALREQERFEEAEVSLNEALNAAIKWHGTHSPYVVDTQLEQVKLYLKWRKLKIAESIASKTLELARNVQITDPKLAVWSQDALEKVRAAISEASSSNENSTADEIK